MHFLCLYQSCFARGRELEREADAIGLNLMGKTCLHLDEAPRVFELLAASMTRMGISENARERTHPTNPERIRDLREQIPAVRAKYRHVCAGQAAKTLTRAAAAPPRSL